VQNRERNVTNYYGSQNSGGINFRLIIGVIIALFGLVTYFSNTSVNPTTGEKQHVTMSADEEIALGLQSAPQMAAEMGGEADASDPAEREVSRIGQQIVDRSDARTSPYKYQFHLLNDRQTVNAFALPGGQIFITRGLYDRLGDEAELAAVLGHEIGHVVERHAAQQVEKGRLGQTLILATGVAESNRRNGLAAWAVADLANHVIQLHFSRADESQADQRGLQFMTQAGFDPRAMIDLMKILVQVSGSGHAPEFLQTHPDPGDRIDSIEQWLRDHPLRSGQLTRGQSLSNP
jgi:predicted Zn-dependent protease